MSVSAGVLKMALRLSTTAIVVAVIVTVLQATNLTAGLEARWIDYMGALFRPEFNEPLVVVAVTQSDFDNPDLFSGLSPLDPGQLAILVNRVADHRPSCVVLDVLIHPAAFEAAARSQGRLALFQALDSLSANTVTKWVLARSPDDEPDLQLVDPEVAVRWRKFVEPHSDEEQGIVWGAPRLELDRGLVRYAHYNMFDYTGESPHLTLFGATLSTVGPKKVPSPNSILAPTEDFPEEPWIIRFTGRLPPEPDISGPTSHFTSSGVLMRGPGPQGGPSILENRIVMIGGTYREGRDYHWTPLGPMPGIYIWAEAIASRLRNDAPRQPSGWLVSVLDAVLGIAAGVVLARMGHLRRMALSIGVLLIASIFFSYLTFGAGFLFINFTPSLLGVLVHYQIEIHLELRKLQALQPKHLEP